MTLVVEFTMVSVQHWQTGLGAAGMFALYCRRAMLLPSPPGDDIAALQACFYGIGIAVPDGHGHRVLLEPAPYTRWQHNAAQWTFAEEIYESATAASAAGSSGPKTAA